MKYLALVAACLLTVTLAAPAVADDEATPTFTWPELTSFNPDVRSYEVTVSGEGDYPYRLTSSEGWVDVPGPGTYAVDFGWSSQARVRVARCSDICEPVTESPALTIVRRLNASWEYDDSWFAVAPGGSRTLRYTMSQVVPGTTLQWSIVPAGADRSAAVTSGEISDPAAKGAVTIQVPTDVRDKDQYDVHLHAELDGEAYGHLTSDAQPAHATIDAQAPRVRIKLDDDVFYPVADLGDWGYPSHLEYQLFSNERVTGTLTFTGPDGAVVERRTGLDFGPYEVYEYWYGEGRRHSVYPEGRYEIRLDVVDEAGNAATATATVRLSHAKQRPVRVTKILPAAKTLVDRSVGSCSSLTFPSSHRWKGSIGYASQSRCDRPADSGITTVHRLYLPKSFENNYQLRIYFYGAAATSKPGSAIASGWINRRGEIEETHVARGPKTRWNILPQGDWSPDLFKDARGRRYVLWALGTSGGNRYDVKSFKYRLRYVKFN